MAGPYDEADDGSPYSGVAPAVIQPPLTVGNPGAANAFAQQHRAAIAGREGGIQSVLQQQQDSAAKMSAIIDETTQALKDSKGGQSNLPLLAFGAGMLSSNGNFGRQVGEGLKAAIPVIQSDRTSDDSFQKDIAGLALKRAGLEEAPLASKLAYMRALQVGDINALRAIEQAQIRTETPGKAGQDPALVKLYKFWVQDPKNQGKSFTDFQTEQSRIGADKNTPPLIREYNLWEARPENTGKPIDDFMRIKANAAKTPLEKNVAAWQARPGNEDKGPEDYVREMAHQTSQGREVGTEQGKAAQALPSVLNNLGTMDTLINQLKVHPGIDNAVGKMWANTTPIPGTPKADFLAKYDQLMGKVFMTAYNNLRGAGAITEAEGLKAIQSEWAPSRNQSKPAFLESLDTYQRKLQEYVDIARQKAGAKGAEAVANPAGTGQHEEPPHPGAKKAPDGKWYAPDPDRPGKYMRVDQ